ncbi:UDP-N-acetylmuramate--L-alanine ligase [Tumidithrix helvetica PCC 7403]|uniref:UDP-N-acetylmuramate--L-alanine ligase n=1 Tax=Tumidithrix helvetica TaxID=3457545 RepID=UPI003CBFD43E
MLSPVDFSGRPFHFIGIGGIGMSAIAHILVKQGFSVSGSDLNTNRVTAQLQELGVNIFQGHHAENIDPKNPPQVVCSTAIGQQNPEFQAATLLGLPILHRSDLLAALIGRYKSIAVAGTHGKTTTSSLVSYLFLKANLDPTIIVGGEVGAWQGNARLGLGAYLVAEADESDGSLVKFAPHVGAITNIELDHPDHYDSVEQVIAIFQEFAQRCQVVVGCLDCPNVRSHIRSDITYSLSDPKADYTVTEVEYLAGNTKAVVLEKGKPLGQISLQILGQHNLSNALAAIAVARYVGIEWADIEAALPEFIGANRRFEVKGRQDGIIFVDDYAHHPSEILATLASAKRQSQSKVIAIFQPHRYSRTTRFLTEFSQAFGDADRVIVTDIYAAGERNETNITGQEVADAIATFHPDVHYQDSLSAVQAFLVKNLKAGDLAIFLGAGNLNQIIAPTIQAMAACCPSK